jgi:hypothetical protein
MTGNRLDRPNAWLLRKHRSVTKMSFWYRAPNTFLSASRISVTAFGIFGTDTLRSEPLNYIEIPYASAWRIFCIYPGGVAFLWVDQALLRL